MVLTGIDRVRLGVPSVLVVDHNPPHLQVFIVSAGVGYGSLEVAVVDVADCSEHGLFDSAPADVCPEGVVSVRCPLRWL